MPIDLYPSVAKVKRNGAYQNLPGFVQRSGDADIEAMIANSETSTTAQFNHPKDSYFILNDILYKANVDIPANGTIVVGTNCHVAVLADEITEIENTSFYNDTVSGQDLEILNSLPDFDVNSFEIDIPYSRSGSGTPSLTNVRPITCATELTLSQKDSVNGTPTEHTFDLDSNTPIGVGKLVYNGNGTWTLTNKYVLVTVNYAFFSGAEKGLSGSGNQVYFRNLFYNAGNGVTYRNRQKRYGGYFCISNVFSIEKGLNDTRNYNSQYRLYINRAGQTGWTDANAALADIKNYLDNGGVIQFLYEPTDSIPTTTYTGEELNKLSGTDYFTTSVGSITVSYKINLLKKINENEDRIEDLEDLTSEPKTDILTANDDAVNKILSSRWLRSETAVPLTLLWFSDLHRWQTPLDRVIKFKNYLQSNGIIDGSIVTGDIVRNSAGEGNTFKTFWEDTTGTEDIMIALGNHDHYAQSETPHGRATFETLDNLFFGNVSSWGVNRESNYPFYYKDYLDKGIRLIVADTFVKTAEADQTTWINNVLLDAIDKNLAVVIACHYLALNSSMETQSVSIYDNSWSNNLARSTGTTTMDYESTDFDLVACVTDFISNGGSFLCYMIGHTHTDIVSHPTGHPDQLIINCACASDDRSHETKLTTNDLPRYANTRTQDCFNVITFDATNKIIKCVRVGANVNMYQIPRTAFGYDVTNHQFISLI